MVKDYQESLGVHSLALKIENSKKGCYELIYYFKSHLDRRNDPHPAKTDPP